MNTLLEPVVSVASNHENATFTETVRPGTKNADQPSARILYVDDEPALRRLGGLVLVKAGYAVDTAGDGAEAWDALHDRDYQLLITDNQMPCLTGEELIHKVRLAHISVPIILASGLLGTRPINDLPWAECHAMLAKPFTPAQLVSVVRKVLLATVSPQISTGIGQPWFEKFQAPSRPYHHWGINE